LINKSSPGLKKQNWLLENLTHLQQALHFKTSSRPASLETVQSDLLRQEALIEYVLADPVSYALAVTHESVTAYPLPGRKQIEPAVKRYVELIGQGKADTGLAYDLFTKLVAPIREFHDHPSSVFVPDGCLYLLPMAALYDGRQYVLATHATSIVPAGTVLHIYRHRSVGGRGQL
jgi:CHAT domain-containing protein